MEYTCSKGGIGVPIGKYIEEMLLGTAATGGDDRNLQPVGELIEGVAGKALLHPIVVHAGEKNLAGTAILPLEFPLEKAAVGGNATAIELARPLATDAVGIDSKHAHLVAEMACNIVDKRGIA